MYSKLLALAFGVTLSVGAVAAPVQALPSGPLYFKFNGNEQIAINGATTYAGGETTWGLFTMSTIERAVVEVPNSTVAPTGDYFFVNNVLPGNAQVTGMFYGVQALPPGTSGNPFPSTSGFLDLYWRDTSIYSVTDNSAATPGLRTSVNTATGYTEGDFLARIRFDSGIIASDPSITIAGDTIPTEASFFTGLATSFGSVDMSAGGLWAAALDGNWFNTVFGQRDIRFRNNYESNPGWNGGNENIIGARLDDPAQAVAVPEPGVLALMGLAMLGMGAARRRRSSALEK